MNSFGITFLLRKCFPILFKVKFNIYTKMRNYIYFKIRKSPEKNFNFSVNFVKFFIKFAKFYLKLTQNLKKKIR